jgi:hypothetical protein
MFEMRVNFQHITKKHAVRREDVGICMHMHIYLHKYIHTYMITCIHRSVNGPLSDSALISIFQVCIHVMCMYVYVHACVHAL